MELLDTSYRDYINEPPQKKIFSIAQAIESEITFSYDSPGIAEEARDVAKKSAEMLGKVVELLHKNGALTDENILSLVHGYEAYHDPGR